MLTKDNVFSFSSVSIRPSFNRQWIHKRGEREKKRNNIQKQNILFYLTIEWNANIIEKSPFLTFSFLAYIKMSKSWFPWSFSCAIKPMMHTLNTDDSCRFDFIANFKNIKFTCSRLLILSVLLLLAHKIY